MRTNIGKIRATQKKEITALPVPYKVLRTQNINSADGLVTACTGGMKSVKIVHLEKWPLPEIGLLPGITHKSSQDS